MVVLFCLYMLSLCAEATDSLPKPLSLISGSLLLEDPESFVSSSSSPSYPYSFFATKEGSLFSREDATGALELFPISVKELVAVSPTTLDNFQETLVLGAKRIRGYMVSLNQELEEIEDFTCPRPEFPHSAIVWTVEYTLTGIDRATTEFQWNTTFLEILPYTHENNRVLWSPEEPITIEMEPVLIEHSAFTEVLLMGGCYLYLGLSAQFWVILAFCLALLAGFCLGRSRPCAESFGLEMMFKTPSGSTSPSPRLKAQDGEFRGDSFALGGDFQEFRMLQEVLNDGNYKRQFTFEKELGEGGFGSVELAKHKLENEYYAIKKVCMKVGVGQHVHTHKFFKEVKTLMQLQSKYIVRYHTCWVERDLGCESVLYSNQSLSSFASEISSVFEGNYMEVVLHIQMEYCEGNTLADWMRARGRVESAGNYKIVYQILKGVDYIHRKHIIHRDLKPANIFISKEEEVKIGDFNLATVLVPECSMNMRLSTNIGSPFYLAPEQEESTEYNNKVDMYSVGIILVELFSLYSTAHERSEELRGVRKSKKIPKRLQEKYPVPAQLAEWCIQEDPSTRPSAEEILVSALFQDWRRQFD